jgi:hypothetical protein
MIRNSLLICAALIYLMAVTSPALSGNDTDLAGLWAFRCERDQASDDFPLEEFTAAFFQIGSSISGACTGGSPEPWNGMVTGQFDGSNIELEVLVIQHPLTVARMAGITNDSTVIAGTFVCSDDTGAGWKGTFNASMTTPETALYEPAASEPLSFVPAVSGGISDFEEETMAAPVEEAPEKRDLQVISYTRDTIYALPVM